MNRSRKSLVVGLALGAGFVLCAGPASAQDAAGVAKDLAVDAAKRKAQQQMQDGAAAGVETQAAAPLASPSPASVRDVGNAAADRALDKATDKALNW